MSNKLGHTINKTYITTDAFYITPMLFTRNKTAILQRPIYINLILTVGWRHVYLSPIKVINTWYYVCRDYHWI